MSQYIAKLLQNISRSTDGKYLIENFENKAGLYLYR